MYSCTHNVLYITKFVYNNMDYSSDRASENIVNGLMPLLVLSAHLCQEVQALI
jgi:hypothetical protein